MEQVAQWAMALAVENPTAASILMGIGFLRTINKPLFSVVERFVQHTETPDDDKWWAKIKGSKGMKGFIWLLDFTASVKIKR